MNKWLTRANQRINLANAAALLIVTSMIGQALGFFRTQIINANFNSFGNIHTDAYFAAFKIPDLFYYTIAAGALGVAFMPFLADKIERGDKQAVWGLTSNLLNFMAVITTVLGFIMLVFTKPLLHLVVGNNLSPDQLHDAESIMRIVSFNPLLFTLSAILISVQQSFGRFFFFALSPIIYNGCIILSVYIFKDSLGLIGLGIGALAGAILQLLFVIFGLSGLRYRYKLGINLKSQEFRRVLRQLPPRSLDQGIDALNSIVETNRASTLGRGAITFYENAYTLHLVPILLFGTTIATAAFPRLNQRLAQNRPDLFRKDFLMVLRVMVWIILPVAVVTFFGRAYFARLIYKNIAPEIAILLGFLVGAIIFRTIYSIVSRYFYAQKDNKTPLFVSVFAILLNIYLAFTLSRPEAYGLVGLALAQSIVAAFEVIILLSIMVWHDPKLFAHDFLSGLVRTLSVTGFTILTTYMMVTLFPLDVSDRGFIKLSAKLLVIIIPTFIVHIAVSSLFGLEEVRPVIKKIKALVLRPINIQ
jgi:putative peptidoglycan lipid II flippase